MYENLGFEGKHVDEKILYFTKASTLRLKYELLKLILPVIFILGVAITLYFYFKFHFFILISVIAISLFFFSFSLFYKIYRFRHNYLYITSKRVLFHGIEGFFKDYVKKIQFENIRNINYFTESILGRIGKYGTLEIQSSHGGEGDIKVYHICNGKNLTHYIDKLISLKPEERNNFAEFDPDYFKNWKK